MKLLTYLVIGLIFGLGISISGMSNPAKVINFFDVAGIWDPSLMFVIGGALIITFIGYRFVLKRKTPIFEPEFLLPRNRKIDSKLVIGSGVFGIGWGISGFCPGGSIPAIGNGSIEILQFTAALIVGILATRFVMKFIIKSSVSQVAK